jgi:ribosomal protein S18 acetylase RimI-like enzyme
VRRGAATRSGRYSIRKMTLSDHADAHRIWKDSEGICVVPEDSRKGIKQYLSRNPGLCFVAVADSEIVGTVLCGHDGRRGILRHLAVKPKFRNLGIGRALTQKCLRSLSRSGVTKCNVFVMDDNSPGLRFWRRLGGKLHEDEYRTFSVPTSG